VPAKPFLGPALNANKDQIEEITARILTDEIIKTMPRKAAFS
jgi:hypothetical protein